MPSNTSRIIVATAYDDVLPHRDAWARLYARRLEDNLFLRPEFLLPLLEHASASYPYRLLFVYGTSDELVGVAVFADPGHTRRHGMVLSTWEHPLAFDMTPLFDRDRGREAATALWSWLHDGGRTGSFVRWVRVRLESRAWWYLAATMDRTGSRWWARRVYARPAMRVDGSWNEYLASLSRSRRKGAKRVMRALARAGEVSVRTTVGPDTEVVGRFLDLERAGWKGDEGTALACERGQERFFRAASSAIGASGDLYFQELCLDGRPIAITANFVSGRTLYAYKTAYDAAARHLSPGVAAELELVRALLADDTVDTIDSCSEASSHVAGLFPGRCTIGEVVVATDAFSTLSLVVAPHARRSRRRARELWDSLGTATG